MLLKDKILNSFLAHEILKEKYDYDHKGISVSSALKSKHKKKS